MARFEGPEGFDPGPVLCGCGVPLLWIQGERDRSLPMAETLAAIEALRAAGRPFEVHVVPGVNHGFRDPRTGERTIVWPIADAWLRRIGVLSAAAGAPPE
jgi:acetyl esterase/lipase